MYNWIEKGNRKMATLILRLEGQLLTKENEQIIASGDCNVDKCQFLFDSTWDGYVKTAVFYQDKQNVSYAVLDKTEECFIPAEAMSDVGKMFIGVFGIKGGNILTSTVESMEILEGAISGVTIDVQPSEDIFLAIIAQYQKIAQEMELHNTKADELIESMNQLQTKVTTDLETQNEMLKNLNAFDVIAMRKTVEEIQSTHKNFTDKMNAIELNTFTIAEVSIAFVNKAFRLEDSRITAKSLVDAYFSTDTFQEAVRAKPVVESCEGYIMITCENAPSYPLFASILIRRV